MLFFLGVAIGLVLGTWATRTIMRRNMTELGLLSYYEHDFEAERLRRAAAAFEPAQTSNSSNYRELV